MEIAEESVVLNNKSCVRNELTVFVKNEVRDPPKRDGECKPNRGSKR